MLINYLLVGAGGFLGAIFRYGTSNLISQKWGNYPFSTLIVNLMGSFILGLVVFGMANGKAITESQRLLIAVGFCGALTTMSTFALDSFQLFEGKGFFMGVLNIVANAIGSLAMIWLAKWIIT